MILSMHAILPGVSLREQSYAAGWARAQLPGQLGRLAWNTLLGDEPISGKGSESRLCVYHHSCMPGSTSVVNLFPETETAIVILQNSLAATDSADLIGQLLAQTIFDFSVKNDYAALARSFAPINLKHQNTLRADLEKKRVPGTTHKPFKLYTGTYWNAIHNFKIEIYEPEESTSQLAMRLQGRTDEEYALRHYHYDTFSWLLTHSEAA